MPKCELLQHDLESCDARTQELVVFWVVFCVAMQRGTRVGESKVYVLVIVT